MRGHFACFAFFWRGIEKTEGGRGDRGGEGEGTENDRGTKGCREKRTVEIERAVKRTEGLKMGSGS
jgi:hypothetical protein